MIREEDLPFIFYNNRSIGGVVQNFMRARRFNPYYLMGIDSHLARANSAVEEESTLLIEKSSLRIDVADISYGPDDLSSYDYLLAEANRELLNPTNLNSESELRWLKSRGMGLDHISRYGLGSMSYVCENSDSRAIEVLGISCHPALSSVLMDDLSGGGIVFPLYKSGTLSNCTVRRISDVGKLKYSQACPEIDVWGLDNVDPELPTWIVEGLFDMVAVNSQAGNQAVSVSSAMWSSMQLYQLLNHTRDIRIFADNDRVGLRSSLVLQRFFRERGIDVPIYVSRAAKDPAEHFFEKSFTWDDVHEIRVDPDAIRSAPDTVFNLTNYLKNRTF